jgi:hypothetical protein
MRITAALALLCAFFLTPAEARQRHRAPVVTQQCFIFCENKPVRVVHRKRVHVQRTHAKHVHVKNHRIAAKPHRHKEKPRFAVAAQITHQSGIVAHPEGCPRTAFCGCGAALRVFGHQVRHLWLAANWFGFPRAPPAPGMVAVRRHHVFVLEQHVGGDQWLTYDANSGRHLTRVHVRSIAGYTIVNPHSG